MSEQSKTIAIVDIFEVAADLDDWVIEVQGLTANGWCLPIIHIDGESLMKNGLYLPVFKIVCKGQLSQSQE